MLCHLRCESWRRVCLIDESERSEVVAAGSVWCSIAPAEPKAMASSSSRVYSESLRLSFFSMNEW